MQSYSSLPRKFLPSLMKAVGFALLACSAQSAMAQGIGSGISKLGLGSAYDANATPMTMFGTSYTGFNLQPRSNGGIWEWVADADNFNNGAGMIYGDVGGGMNFVTIPSQRFSGAGQQVISSAAIRSTYVSMRIADDGKVQIGLTLPDQTVHSDYKLAVAGKIVGQSLYITRPASWADYVFAPGYKLRPLPELADYISCHSHLPDVPNTAEVLRDGYDLSQMNARLLQKVEELTLYVISLNQKVTALEAAAARKQ